MSVKYEGKIDLSVKNNSHTLAYDLISNDSNGRRCRILEVGCSTGYFGQALKDAGHEVWGIEMVPEPASIAEGVLDKVYVGTIEAFLEEDTAKTVKFDYITFGDVLEHLPYPADTLRKCKSILTPTGAIIASIPNVAHLAVRLMLLEGRWEYSNLGIMDNTHLRFFTKNSIIQMFNESSYAVESLDCVRTLVEATGIKVNRKLQEHIEPMLKDDEQNVFQFVLLARGADNTQEAIQKTQQHLWRSLRVLCLLPDTESSLAKIRILDPLRTWANVFGGKIRIRSLGDASNTDDELWADVVVFQREASLQILHQIKHFRSMHKKVIYDLDDLLTEVPAFLQMHEYCRRTRPFLQKALQCSDAVTVTNQRLRDELMQFNKNIAIIPNCSAPPAHVINAKRSSDGVVNLVIASSDTIKVDFIVPVLEKLLRQNEVRFNLIGIGAPGKSIADAGLKITLYDNMTHGDFKEFISGLDNAIGLIPLDDSKFSSCKSAIKFIDYSLCGMVSICSAVPPYTDVVDNDKTGLLAANDEESWYGSVMRLAKSRELREELVATAHALCMENFSTRVSADSWQRLFESLRIDLTRRSSQNSTAYRKTRRLSLLMQYLMDASTYRQALRIFKQDGVAGIKKRLNRL